MMLKFLYFLKNILIKMINKIDKQRHTQNDHEHQQKAFFALPIYRRNKKIKKQLKVNFLTPKYSF